MTDNSVGRIGILAAPQSPMLGHVLQAFADDLLNVTTVIMDSKAETEKDLGLWNERTEGRLSNRSLIPFEKQGIFFHKVRSHCDRETVALIQELKLDLLVNGGTPRILTGDVLTAPKPGILNVHPGLLPAYRGCTCVEWAIFNDDAVGNTAHFMTDGIDEGPIVLQEKYQFSKYDRYTDVRVQVYSQGFKLLATAARKILREKITLRDLQPQGPGNYYKPIDEEKLLLVKQRLKDGLYQHQL